MRAPNQQTDLLIGRLAGGQLDNRFGGSYLRRYRGGHLYFFFLLPWFLYFVVAVVVVVVVVFLLFFFSSSPCYSLASKSFVSTAAP